MSAATATYHRSKRMNGRMHGSVQDPTSQQGFNRYAYCFYNPLKYVDPTGERAFGPSWVDLVRMCKDWAMEQRRRAFQMGVTKVMSDLETASQLAGFVFFSWGDGGSSGSNNDNSGIARKNENGEMTPDTNWPMTGDGDPTKNGKDGRTPETAMDAENLFLTCYMNYLCGNNQDIYVDASSMTEKLSGLNIDDDFSYLGNGKYSIDLFSDHFMECPDLALALGNINLEYVNDDMYNILPDKYDFNLNFGSDGRFEFTTRNVGTFLGGLIHYTFNGNTPRCVSGSFMIYFVGKIHINPKP